MADHFDLKAVLPDFMIRDSVFGLYGVMLRFIHIQNAGREVVNFLQLSWGNDHCGPAIEARDEKGRVISGVLCRSSQNGNGKQLLIENMLIRPRGIPTFEYPS